MAEIIKARVWQKIATEAEWNVNPLVLGHGEQAFVVTPSGAPVNFKIGDGTKTFAQLPWYFDDIVKAGFFGSASPSDTPTPASGDGFWIVSEAGTYTNFGGVVLPINSYGFITRIGSSYELIVSSVDLSAYVTTEEFNLNHTSLVESAEATITISGSVQSSRTAALHLLDKAIVKIRAFEIGGRIPVWRLFNFPSNTGYANIAISLMESESQSTNDLNSFPAVQWFAPPPQDVVANPIQTIALTQTNGKAVVELTIDFSVFSGLQHIFNFVQTGAGFVKSGILNDRLEVIPLNKNFSGTLGLFEAGSLSDKRGAALSLNKAIYDIDVQAEPGLMFNLHSQARTSTEHVFVFRCCQYDATEIVSDSKPRYGQISLRIPTTETGVVTVTGVNGLQASPDFNVTMRINLNQLPAYEYSMSHNSPERFNLKSIVLRETVLARSNNFYLQASRNAAGNIVDSEDYRMTPVIRIPEGSTHIRIVGSFNSTANMMYMDARGKLLGWALANGDGSKWDQGGTHSNGTYSVLEGARFCVCTVTTGSSSSAAVFAVGALSDRDAVVSRTAVNYQSVHEAMSDRYFNGVFAIDKTTWNKQTPTIIEKLNDNRITPTAASRLDEIPNLELVGGKIIPVHGSVTGGRLVSIDDEGNMYFVNQNARIFYKSTDGGQTFVTLFDATSKPDMFDTFGTQTEDRAHIMPLPNGELLIGTRMRGPAGPTPQERYWGVWVTKDGQTDADLKFRFSYEGFVLDGSKYSTGCLLSNWTSDAMGSLVVVTEYGAGTSEYWLSQGQNNNGRGVSGRAWCSFDYGVTWKKMFDADRKISGTAEADNNWYYFSSTLARKMAHMHTVKIDRMRNKVYLTNGDSEDYIWSVDIDVLRAWYDSAPAVDPNVFPTYQTSDTFPDWDSALIVQGSRNHFGWYTHMHFQTTQIMPISTGLILGHDAPREFAFFITDLDVANGSMRIEPTYCFEIRSDFPSDAAYEASIRATDGFSQGLVRKDASSPILLTHSGTGRNRIWATFDGLQWRSVGKFPDNTIGFGTIVLFDKVREKVYLSDRLGGDSIDGGYYELKEV